MKKLLSLAAALLLIASAGVAYAQYNPRAGATFTVVTGGTAVAAVPAGALGCYIINPLTSTDQGIMTAEPLNVNPVTTASATANGTTTAVAPGNRWDCVPNSRVAVSVNAATSGHKFVVVRW